MKEREGASVSITHTQCLMFSSFSMSIFIRMFSDPTEFEEYFFACWNNSD